ncbi:carrier superfamily protein [Cystoisospora suis]|uniref:Carrier superfamily protein n=1 Tax=Cystoisospora suis TaxID=483139 RepID=A0A2C6L6Y4_9APIC|nr:carrier superfamily protein [Cystoisospora suis]
MEVPYRGRLSPCVIAKARDMSNGISAREDIERRRPQRKAKRKVSEATATHGGTGALTRCLFSPFDQVKILRQVTIPHSHLLPSLPLHNSPSSSSSFHRTSLLRSSSPILPGKSSYHTCTEPHARSFSLQRLHSPSSFPSYSSLERNTSSGKARALHSLSIRKRKVSMAGGASSFNRYLSLSVRTPHLIRKGILTDAFLSSLPTNRHSSSRLLDESTRRGTAERRFISSFSSPLLSRHSITQPLASSSSSSSSPFSSSSSSSCFSRVCSYWWGCTAPAYAALGGSGVRLALYQRTRFLFFPEGEHAYEGSDRLWRTAGCLSLSACVSLVLFYPLDVAHTAISVSAGSFRGQDTFRLSLPSPATTGPTGEVVNRGERAASSQIVDGKRKKPFRLLWALYKQGGVRTLYCGFGLCMISLLPFTTICSLLQPRLETLFSSSSSSPSQFENQKTLDTTKSACSLDDEKKGSRRNREMTDIESRSRIDSPSHEQDVDSRIEQGGDKERKRENKEDCYKEWTATVLAAFTSGLIAQLATYPLDTLRRRKQMEVVSSALLSVQREEETETQSKCKNDRTQYRRTHNLNLSPASSSSSSPPSSSLRSCSSPTRPSTKSLFISSGPRKLFFFSNSSSSSLLRNLLRFPSFFPSSSSNFLSSRNLFFFPPSSSPPRCLYRGAGVLLVKSLPECAVAVCLYSLFMTKLPSLVYH